MPSHYHSRYVTIQVEDNGYGATPSATTAYTGEVDDESFQHRFDLLTRTNMAFMGASKSVNGKLYSEGGLNVVLQPDNFCLTLLGAAFNQYTHSASGGSVNHTFEETVDGGVATSGQRLPSFLIKVGREDKLHTYPGMCLSRLSLSANVGEYVMLSADFIGQGEEAVGNLTSPTFTGAAVDGFHFADATVYLDPSASAAVAADVKSFSCEWSLNLDTDNSMSLGSQTYTTQPFAQAREITGTLEFAIPKVSTGGLQYSNIVNNDAGLKFEGANYAIKLVLQNNAEAPATADLLEIFIYSVHWEAPTNNVSGRDSSTMSVNFVGLVDVSRNSGLGEMSKIEYTGATSDGTTLTGAGGVDLDLDL